MGGPAALPDRRQGRLVTLASRPRSPHAHVWRSARGHHLFVVDGSRLFDVDAEQLALLDEAISASTEAALLDQLGVGGPAVIDDQPPQVPVHAFSLAVAQKCNLGCTYCYAQQGEFGGAARDMALDTALQAVDMLVAATPPGGKFNLAFLGGEPLANRAVLRAATTHAADMAARHGITPSFAITTNGTLLTPGDAEFFDQHGFAVTISLDGRAEDHDRLRPFKGGRGSFDRIMTNVRPMLVGQSRMQVSARVTVTPDNLALRPVLDDFIAEGFHSVGFSALLKAPNGQGEMKPDQLDAMLAELLLCGEEFERRTAAGQPYPFANMQNAMREISRGTHRPYPCGAGAGYFGVSADGDLAACHRFVGDDNGAMGTLATGIDLDRQSRWLTERHVHRQTPCSVCWARYLCGGGCHHEVLGRGRPACDFIRGWLHYCLEAYLRLGGAP
ncbi:MAG: SPASM domain-containing protein [Rhodospirillaceae bacterium]|nr:SPASM domain-containing protein [Rhodospirillales bacterium]